MCHSDFLGFQWLTLPPTRVQAPGGQGSLFCSPCVSSTSNNAWCSVNTCWLNECMTLLCQNVFQIVFYVFYLFSIQHPFLPFWGIRTLVFHGGEIPISLSDPGVGVEANPTAKIQVTGTGFHVFCWNSWEGSLKQESCMSVVSEGHCRLTACLGVEPRLGKATRREIEKKWVLMTLLFRLQLVSICISFPEQL